MSHVKIDYFMPVSQMLTDFYKKYLVQTTVYLPHSLDYIQEVSALESKIISIGNYLRKKDLMIY